MEARVTISKETMEKSKIDNRSLRKLRLEKLKELDEEGKLSKATCRTDVTKMLGFSGGYDNGYTWISKIIKDGLLQETFLGFNSKDKAEYEYHVKGTPQPSAKTTAVPKVKPITKPVVLSRAYIPEVEKSETKMVIRYGDLSIELENVNYEIIERIVDKLANK